MYNYKKIGEIMSNLIERFFQWNINRKQANLDKEYALYGYSDELLEKQVKLNEEKFKRNIKQNEYLQ